MSTNIKIQTLHILDYYHAFGAQEESKKHQIIMAWDPTICIVGDMKQSIYRFRQAEVTVMRRTVENIKRMNQIEFGNTNFEFRTLDNARDPSRSLELIVSKAI